MSRRQAQIPQSLPDWMLSIALRSRRDPVGESRGICALRILRRQFPEHALELARRMAPPTAQVEARMPILQREGAVLVRDVTFQGTTVPKGTAVESLGASSGYVTVHYGAYGVVIEIPLADMRAMTDADRKRLERAEVARGQPAPDVETDSPSP